MNKRRLNNLMKDDTAKHILHFIPNELGVNLCSVKDVKIERQKDNQITDIHIIFEPKTETDKEINKFVEKELEKSTSDCVYYVC